MPDIGTASSIYEKLIRLLYGAVCDQSRWQDFLEELARGTGVCTHLFGFDIPAGISLGLTASGYAPEYMQSYNDYYGEVNSWAPGFAKGRPGVVLPSQWMCPKEELFKTEFYNDWVRPQEDVAAGGGAILFKDETRMLAFGGNIRLKDEEKLERPWLEIVGLLTPHLQQAFEIARVLAGRSLEHDLLRKGHATGDAAVLILAENAFLLFANERADEMLREGRVLRSDRAGRVGLADSRAAARLERCLRALRAGDPAAAAGFAAHVDGSPSAAGAGGAVVRAIRFDPEAHGVAPLPLLLTYPGRSLLVTVSCPQQDGVAAESLAASYGLTAAETAIVTGIAEGRTTAELADRRGVSLHTVRNQLKSAMSKMNARRQSDLVRTVARLSNRI